MDGERERGRERDRARDRKREIDKRSKVGIHARSNRHADQLTQRSNAHALNIRSKVNTCKIQPSLFFVAQTRNKSIPVCMPGCIQASPS